VAATIEYGLAHAGGFRALGQQRAGTAGALAFLQRAQLGLEPGDSGECGAGDIVDQLRAQATVGAEHRDPGTARGARDLRAHTAATFETAVLFGDEGHRYALFPTLCATYS